MSMTLLSNHCDFILVFFKDEIEKELKEATKRMEYLETTEYNWEFGDE